jgi:hypothetical protein
MPCRKRVTPVKVVYASLGLSEATSFCATIGKRVRARDGRNTLTALPIKSRVAAFLSLFSEGR